MKSDFDALRTEIQEYLEAENFVIFHGQSRGLEAMLVVRWDCERYPDFRLFLKTARQAGVTLIVYNHNELDSGQLEDLEQSLEASELERDERRAMERRIRDLRKYEGFTSSVELSFDYQGRVYLFEIQTDWYEELLDIMEEMEVSMGQDEGEDDEPIGGYFSRN